MNFMSTYEAPLRSYVQDRIAFLENTLQQEVRNRGNVDITHLEQQFDRESDHFIAGVTRQIHKIRDEIKAHRPTNIHSPDYETRMVQYQYFIQSSSIGMNRMSDWVNSIFAQVTGIVKLVVRWLADNSQTIIDVLGRIRDAFKFIGTFFHYN